MKEIVMKKIPLEIIIKTDNKSEYKLINKSLPSEDLVNVINDSMRKITQKYIEYLSFHEKGELEKLEIYIPQKDFKLIENLPLNIVDSANHKKKKVRNITYNLIKKILENKGYETADLKLINFTESEDSKTIYYKKIISE